MHSAPERRRPISQKRCGARTAAPNIYSVARAHRLEPTRAISFAHPGVSVLAGALVPRSRYSALRSSPHIAFARLVGDVRVPNAWSVATAARTKATEGRLLLRKSSGTKGRFTAGAPYRKFAPGAEAAREKAKQWASRTPGASWDFPNAA